MATGDKISTLDSPLNGHILTATIGAWDFAIILICTLKDTPFKIARILAGKPGQGEQKTIRFTLSRYFFENVVHLFTRSS